MKQAYFSKTFFIFNKNLFRFSASIQAALYWNATEKRMFYLLHFKAPPPASTKLSTG
ncbi:hypothetical protein AmDm5_2270 [Acetobacter malorum]|nr:hypothetical protein AmDm5_2270 [Acetobacter malorum]